MRLVVAAIVSLATSAYSQNATTTTVTATTTTPAYGVNSTYAISVSPLAATGTVTLYDGTVSEGTATLSGGSATFIVIGQTVASSSQVPLAGGPHTITASYAGNGSYAASTSAPLSITVGNATTSELLGTVTAAQVSQGLGVNLDNNEDWEFSAAKAMGATWARMQCPWVANEGQTAPPNNTSTGYTLDPNCAAGLVSLKNHGMQGTIVAAFGAPYHQILTVTVPGGAAVGATSLNINFVSGVGGDTLSNIAFPYDYILGPNVAPNYGVLSQNGSYQGTLVTGVTQTGTGTATITLASSLKTALPANSTQYTINEILYPSTATTATSDPSVVAYANYAMALASEMNTAGVTGDVEIWNEPPWNADPWDNRTQLYDNYSQVSPTPTPGPTDQGEPNFGFALQLATRTPPSGVRFTWNGTAGNGEASLMGPQMPENTTGHVNISQPSTVVTAESVHPYGNNPEDFNYLNACLAGTVTNSQAFTQCYLQGAKTGSNLMAARQFSLQQQAINASYGLGDKITETGVLAAVPGMEVGQARFNVRQFLASQANGYTPVEFFKLYDANATAYSGFGTGSQTAFTLLQASNDLSVYVNNVLQSSPSQYSVSGTTLTFVTAPGSGIPVTVVLADPSFSFVKQVSGWTGSGSNTTYAPKPDYVAMSGLMADVNSISALPPQVYSAASLPSVASYSGYYPLTSVNLVGARVGASKNSLIYAVWQRSYTGGTWIQMASPPAGTATINVPFGMAITSVTDAVSRAAVSYTTSASTATFAVADDPVEIMMDPGNAGTGSLILGGSISLGGNISVK